MKIMKRTLVIVLCAVTCLSMFIVAGCSDDNANNEVNGTFVTGDATVQPNTNDNADATISQPQVDVNSFPDNYEKLEQKVYFVIASPKSTDNKKTTGSDALKIISSSKGKITDELNKELKEEIISCVNDQVDAVNCTDVNLEQNPNNDNMGLLTVTFTYKSTGGEDKKIFNVSLI